MSTTPSEIASLRVRLCTANEYGIWTGGAQAGKMDSVNATSLLGGLRFWTGALLRANGENVCEDRCQYDDKAKEKPCALCSIFGCTGLSRVFTFKVGDLSGKLHNEVRDIKLTRHAHNGDIPKYRLRFGYKGAMTCSLVPRRPPLEGGFPFALPAAVPTALYLMVKYGTLGAYDQYGCGLVRFDTPEGEQELRGRCLTHANTGTTGQGVSLRDFFFFKGPVVGDAKESMANIRHAIRNALRGDFSADVRHWFCGSRGEYGTNYALTINSDGLLYGWGHFARSGPGITDARLAKREDVLNAIKRVLAQQEFAGKSLVWRECGSDRDTVKKQEWPDFYTSLINDAWRQA